MQLHPRSVLTRAQAALVVLAVTLGLTVAPALVSTVSAAGSATAQCDAAQAAVKKAQQKQAASKAKVAKAKKTVAKAKKAKKARTAKVRKAKKSLTAAKKSYAAAQKAVKTRQGQAKTACAVPNPPVPNPPAPKPQAENTGKKLSLLAVGNGLPVEDLDAGQLSSLLEQLLPGVTDQLDLSQLTSLLAGFNAGSDLDPAAALALLSGVLDPSAITDLLGGEAGPEVLTGLIEDIVGQLSSLGGGLPIPTDLDVAGLWDTFAGIFGVLSADQLGSLLAMVTGALGASGEDLDLGQLTDLIDSLVPGISEQFDAGQLTSMLAGLNGGGLSVDTLANLLGGQFSPTQLLEVVNGTAGQALLGSVLAQVMAQLGTAGGGGLELPGELSLDALTGIIATVTDLLTSVLGGGGGGVLPVVCGLIPIPVLCP